MPEDNPTSSAPELDATAEDVATVDDAAARILVIRGRRVLLDVDVARLYGVTPKRLNEQVKRNRARFPDDFLLHLTREEAQALLASRSQSQAVSQIRPSSSCRWPGHQSRERVT